MVLDRTIHSYATDYFRGIIRIRTPQPWTLLRLYKFTIINDVTNASCRLGDDVYRNVDTTYS